MLLRFSFVRSATMDKWKDIELEKMKASSNREAQKFLQSQPDYEPGMSFHKKWNSKAAALLRDKVPDPDKILPLDSNSNLKHKSNQLEVYGFNPAALIGCWAVSSVVEHSLCM